MSIAAAVITGLIAIGTTIVEGVISSNAQDSAQREAQDLYNQQRKAEQRQRNIENRSARRSLDLSQRALDFDQGMLQQDMAQKETEKQDLIKQSKHESFMRGLSGINENKDQSLLFRQNAAARWGGNA